MPSKQSKMKKVLAVAGPRSPYNEAADLMNQVLSKPRRKSLKNLAYDRASQLRVTASTYAIVSKVCDHQRLLEKIIQQVPISAKNRGLLYVLLFELLLSEKQSIVGGGALKRAILEKEADLRQALTKHRNKATTTSDNPKNKTTETSLLQKIRYIRVNTCRTTAQQVLQKLQSLQIPIFSDPHVPDLFVMDRQHTSKILQQSKTLFHNMRDIILQDKSSCFSALCLASGIMDHETSSERRDVLDACAAPGNKTSHLAALLPTESTIIALDRDAERFQLLKKRMQELIPLGSNQKQRILVKHQDFLQTRPSDFPSICAILLDPSCSGSGIRNEHINEERLQELAKFQIAALSHAMKFPQVQYIVYSTCSIETLENEHVMGSCKNPDWNIVAPVALASWKRRGLSHPSLTPEESQCLIRVHADEDDANGFFVGCWQRRRKEGTSPSRPYTFPTPLAPIFSRDAWKQVNGSANPISPGKKRKQSNQESPTKLVSKQPKMDNKNKTTKNIPPKAKSQGDDDHHPAQICKKRLKKMEWKRKQREQKRARLDAQQKTTTG